MAETQPQLQPALLRLSAMISQGFTRDLVNVAQRWLGEEFLRIHLRRLLARLFGREGGDDLLEARIAAERVPKGRSA